MNTRKLFLFIILLATILRLWGMWHGYPYSYYPDEAHFVKRALSFGSFDFNPHWFHKPAFYMYILFFEYGIYFIIGKLLGLWSAVSDFALSYITNPGPFYLIGRFTSVLFSLGTIWVTYKVGERHFKTHVGIVASLFLSVSYGHIAASQAVKADIPAAFFGILSMLFLLNYYEERDLKNLIASAAAAGIGTATKTYPIVMMVPIIVGLISLPGDLVTVFSRKFLRITSLIFLVIVIFFLFYFLCSPYNFVDAQGFRSTFARISTMLEKMALIPKTQPVVSPDAFISEPTSLAKGCISYFRALYSQGGLGLPITLVSMLGLFYLIRKFDKKILLFLLYPATFVFISILNYPGYAESRHQVPIYPFLTIAGASVVVQIAEFRRSLSSLVYLTLTILLCNPTYSVVNRALFISKEDTRNLAKVWIEGNISPGTKLLVDENGPQLLMNEQRILSLLPKALEADSKGQFTAHFHTYLKYQLSAAALQTSTTYDLHEVRFPWWRESEVKGGVHDLTSEYDKDMANPLRRVGVEPYDYYVDNGFLYAVVHSKKYERFLKDTLPAKNFPSLARFYRDLFNRAILMKEFSPKDDERPGPTVKIFRLVPDKLEQ